MHLETLIKTLKNLISITNDWHESNNVYVNVVGTRLNNSYGDKIDAQAIIDQRQEMVLVIYNADQNRTETINLANLITVARLANLKYPNIGIESET